MASPISPLYTGIESAYTSDTGSGGLAETGDGTARVFHMVEADEKQPATPASPWISVGITADHRDSLANTQVVCMVDFITHTLDDTDPAKRRAVVNRIETLYDNGSITVLGWTVDSIRHKDSRAMAKRGQWNRWRDRFVVYLTD